MKVMLFQIVILIIILYAGHKGKTSLNIVCAFFVVFTISMVNTSPLMMLQFFTITIGYIISLEKIKRVKQLNKSLHIENKYYQKSLFEILIRLIVNIILMGLLIYGSYIFTIEYYKGIDDIGYFLFASISYIIIIGVSVLIFGYLLLRSLQLIKDTKKIE